MISEGEEAVDGSDTCVASVSCPTSPTTASFAACEAEASVLQSGTLRTHTTLLSDATHGVKRSGAGTGVVPSESISSTHATGVVGVTSVSPSPAGLLGAPRTPAILPAPDGEKLAGFIDAARAAGRAESAVDPQKGCIFSCLEDPRGKVKLAAVFLFVAAGCALSVWLYVSLRASQFEGWQQTFNYQCAQRLQLVQSQLVFSGRALRGYGGYITAVSTLPNGSIPLNEPAPFTTPQLAQYSRASGAHGSLDLVIYMPYVPPNSTLGTIRWLRQPDADAYLPLQAFDPPYPVYDLTGWDGMNLEPAPAYTPIFNVTNVVQSSGVVALKRSKPLFTPQASWGIGLATAIFAINETQPADLPTRYSTLSGFVFSIVPIDDLLARAIGTLAEPIELTMYDAVAPVLTQFLGTGNALHEIDGHRAFQLVCSPGAGYATSAYSSYPIWIAVGTFVIFAMQLTVLALGSSCIDLRHALKRSEALVLANQHKDWALEKLEEARKDAEEANISKSDFMAFLCHELRNPLHAIVAMIEELRHASLAPDDMDNVQTIRASANMMRSIVNDALDMTKIESGHIEFESVPFSLWDIVRTLARVETGQARAKGIHLQLTLDPAVPLVFYGDPTRIRQVLINFITNAIKFTAKGHVHVQMRLVPPAEARVNGIEPFAQSAPLQASSLAMGISSMHPTQLPLYCPCAPGGVSAPGGVLLPITSAQQPSSVPSTTGDGATLPLWSQPSVSGGPPTSTFVAVTPSPLPTSSVAPPASSVPQLSITISPAAGGGIAGLPPSPPDRKIRALAERAATTASASNPPTATFSSVVAARGPPSPPVRATLPPPSILSMMPPISSGPLVYGAAGSSEPAVPLPPPIGIATVELSVTDSGMGIEPELIPRLFEPYSQAKLSIMRDHGGTGLGLAIVSRIVRMMGGHVFVESEVGKGSSFSAQVPLLVAPPDVPVVHLNASFAARQSPASIPHTRHLGTDHERHRVGRRPSEQSDGSHEDEKDVEAANGTASSNPGGGGDVTSTEAKRAATAHDRGEEGLRQSPQAGAIRPPASGDTSRLPSQNQHVLAHLMKLAVVPVAPGSAAAAGSSGGILYGRAPQSSAAISSASVAESDSPMLSERSMSSWSTGHLGGSGGNGDSHSGVDTVGSTPEGSLDSLAMRRGSGNARSSSSSSAASENASAVDDGTVSGTSVMTPSIPQPSSPARGPSSRMRPAQTVGTGADGSVDSPPGPGSLSLTLASALNGRSVAARQSSHAKAATQAAAAAKARYGDRLFLVVDDLPLNVKILVKLLQGFSCVTAANGVEAVEAVKNLLENPRNGKRQFDMILTDIIMPVMDGLQAAREIRKVEEECGVPPVPMIALTANAMQHDRTKCAEAGMSFLSKPFVRGDLYRLLDATFLRPVTACSPVATAGAVVSSDTSPTTTTATSTMPAPASSSALFESASAVSTPRFERYAPILADVPRRAEPL